VVKQSWRSKASRIRHGSDMRLKNMNKTIYILLCAAGLLAGCASQRPAVLTHIDPYTRARTDLMAENMLESPEPVREVVWLNASRMFRNQRDYQYYLELDYMARAETGFLEIPPGETLVIIAGDKELRFSGSGSLNSRREQKTEVSERAIYPATGDQLRTIAGAESVKVNILGRNGMVQRTFNAENADRFRQFVQHYVPAQ
jgi:hypothetical protein